MAGSGHPAFRGHGTPPIAASIHDGPLSPQQTPRAHDRRGSKDPGAAGVLAAYETARRGDVLTRMAAADLLNRTLISGFLPLQLARGAGLMALSISAPLRRAAMRRGMAAA